MMTTQIHYLPRWFPLDGFALGESIWVKPDRPGLMQHEMVHIKQQQSVGKWRFLWRYIISPSYRVSVETAAYKVQGVSSAAIVDILYSWIYLWCFPLRRNGIKRIVDSL